MHSEMLTKSFPTIKLLRSCIQSRNRTYFLSNKRRITNGMSTVREIKIPVPWGHVAARDWGDENGHPVLAVHGWLDNAGSFDPLISSIDKNLNLRIVAIDLPGHGLSSHIPPGFSYNYMEYLTLTQRIIQNFGWKKLSFIGHSLGAGLTAVFSSLYPKIVEKAIFLDFVKPVSMPIKMMPDISKAGINGHLAFEEKAKKGMEPVHTKEVALKRLMDSSPGALTEESAKILLKRGIKPSEDGKGYVFTRDYRLRIPSLASFTVEQHMEYLKRLSCQLLVIMANDHSGWEEESLIKATVDMYRNNCKYFEYHEVSGGHHFHLNSAHAISETVNNFLRREE